LDEHANRLTNPHVRHKRPVCPKPVCFYIGRLGLLFAVVAEQPATPVATERGQPMNFFGAVETVNEYLNRKRRIAPGGLEDDLAALSTDEKPLLTPNIVASDNLPCHFGKPSQPRVS
jgi:hypothetical protein